MRSRLQRTQYIHVGAQWAIDSSKWPMGNTKRGKMQWMQTNPQGPSENINKAKTNWVFCWAAGLRKEKRPARTAHSMNQASSGGFSEPQPWG
jgi:hypothetical protein